MVECFAKFPDLTMRLQETLMNGVLQKLLVIVGHWHVAADPPAVIIGWYLKHRGTHPKQRRFCTTKPNTKAIQNFIHSFPSPMLIVWLHNNLLLLPLLLRMWVWLPVLWSLLLQCCIYLHCQM